MTANLDDSKAGYYTMKFSEKMPEYFRKLFRAREPLAHVKPAEEKNYAGKPYLGLDLNGSQGLMARFEDAIPQPELTESKAVIKARRKKEKVMEDGGDRNNDNSLSNLRRVYLIFWNDKNSRLPHFDHQLKNH